MASIRDWRGIPAAMLAPLFEDERRCWARDLRWDTTGAHAQVEQARTTWGLPGRVSVDAAGRLDGLVYFLDAGHRLEIGGIIAASAAVTAALVDAVLDHAATLGNPPIVCFASGHAPGLTDALTCRGFDVEPFSYDELPLAPAMWGPASAGPDVTTAVWGPASAGPTAMGAQSAPLATRAWQLDDLVATAALLHRAYEPDEGGWFAPGHTLEAWQLYLRNLVDYGACGSINPAASRCVAADGGRIAAVTLVTTISADTAHLVQVAVDPGCRGGGLAARLVRESCVAAGRQGNRAITLMVARRNARARALYSGLGFCERAAFVAASRG